MMERNTTHAPAVVPDPAIFYLRVFWMIGITISCLSLLTQLLLLLIIPRCRKFDEKVLVQLTATRIVNTICEYYFLNEPPHDTQMQRNLLDASFLTGVCTDFILVSWMFMFTKNLYDKVVAVFVLDKWNFILVTVLIWCASLPIGTLFLVMIKHFRNYFKYCYDAYYCVKFIILLINALFFIRIFYVAKSRGKISSSRNLTDVIRTTVAAFILVLTNVLQVLSTDLVIVFYGENKILTMSSSVLNSFHVIPIMIIFILVMRAKLRGSVLRTVSTKLTRL